MLIKKFENRDLKITVEERSDGKVICTYWDKNMCLEFDRTVKEFETSGGALYEAFDLLAEIIDSEYDSSIAERNYDRSAIANTDPQDGGY